MNQAIITLMNAVVVRFGAETFPVEDARPQQPDQIGFTSSADRRVYLSVITAGQPDGCYSLMVEVWRDGDADFPFAIAVDRDGLSLPDVLDLFAQYRTADEYLNKIANVWPQ
jgi:hypothetical protein